MKPRLSRPLLAALVSGALVAGGAIYTSPASAGLTPVQALKAEESASPSPSVSASASESASASPSPSVSESASTSPSPSVSASASTSPSPSASSSTPPKPDTKAPVGTFKLSRTSVWIGQPVVFSQPLTSISDDVSKPQEIVRKISWGDGSTATLTGTTTSYVKKYTKNGKFTVTETLTDKSGKTGNATSRYTVTVTTPGAFSLNKRTAYQGVRFNVKVSKIPSGTSMVKILWSDNTYSSVNPRGKSTVTITGWIRNWNDRYNERDITGKRTLTAQFQNKYGITNEFRIGTITILADSSKPALKITKPSSPSKASSWKTIRGTASDKGSGLRSVVVFPQRISTSGATYCMISKTKWQRWTTEAQFDKCKVFQVKVTKGKWSFKLASGLTKGAILVSAGAQDWAGNSKLAYREAMLTRS